VRGPKGSKTLKMAKFFNFLGFYDEVTSKMSNTRVKKE
jgi:hypothetical protein